MAEQTITNDSIYSNRRFPGGVSRLCIDFRANQDDVVKALTDDPANRAASRWLDKNRRLSENFAACYIISCDAIGRTKIGYSTNPDVRLRGMGTALPYKPEMVALFWSFRWNAKIIEGKCLNRAKALGVRSNGEWVTTNGHDTTRLALDAVRHETPFIDSAGFLEHWVSRSDFPAEFYTAERIELERSGSGPIRGFLHK